MRCLVDIAQSLTEEYNISMMEHVIHDLLEINKAFKLKKSSKRKKKPSLNLEPSEVSCSG